jgi:hypothetical protein
MPRRWIIHRDAEVVGYYLQADLPEVEAGCVAMELSDADDGVSEWYRHEEHGWIMVGTEPDEEEHDAGA